MNLFHVGMYCTNLFSVSLFPWNIIYVVDAINSISDWWEVFLCWSYLPRIPG